ncbi:hypothetical protein [Ramlibacter albus]|uniref:Uncharacterized protein n=1 Tax=Ramlibacter albus TaxID=2079448 RepID=A0A923MA67_9BURK|nr:hypothetical protein [Ramlibacter albus]MBC5765599.1 hypothetical protein [Ramlibacter albus]
MLDGIAQVHALEIVQLPKPGSMLEGQPVTDQTSRRAPIEPIAHALLSLPPGSVALAALNSENIYAVLNRLGIPVPCTDNSCYPRNEFDHLWHIVLPAGQPRPLAFTELRYGSGWQFSAR